MPATHVGETDVGQHVPTPSQGRDTRACRPAAYIGLDFLASRATKLLSPVPPPRTAGSRLAGPISVPSIQSRNSYVYGRSILASLSSMRRGGYGAWQVDRGLRWRGSLTRALNRSRRNIDQPIAGTCCIWAPMPVRVPAACHRPVLRGLAVCGPWNTAHRSSSPRPNGLQLREHPYDGVSWGTA